MTKVKEIFKHEYAGKWPFKCSSIKIKQNEQECCFAKIKGEIYCLNGMARDRYPKRKNIFDSGFVIKGKSIGPIIDRALEL